MRPNPLAWGTRPAYTGGCRQQAKLPLCVLVSRRLVVQHARGSASQESATAGNTGRSHAQSRERERCPVCCYGFLVTGHTPLERREIHYRGWVQGVGFRYTAQRIARQHGVVGFVRNLPDGRVQLVAEGAAEQLDECLAQVAKTLEGYIESVEVEKSEATGECSGFDIRF